jgi:uncharacterized protein
MSLAETIAAELRIPEAKVAAVIDLLAAGNTVPFIARYRKERTGNLDDVQIRAIEERHAYLQELEKRRAAILKSIEEQGALTEELREKILAASTKTALEDLYLPFKPKRRTRALIARERGLGPLGERILAQPDGGDPLGEAAAFVDPEKGVDDGSTALAGARDIAAEEVAVRPEVRALARERYAGSGLFTSTRARKPAEGAEKFRDYFDYAEPVGRVPSHRFLAVKRGEREGALKCGIAVGEERLAAEMLRLAGHRPGTPFATELELAVGDCLKRLVGPSVETDVAADLKERSDAAAVEIFADNLRNLLLAAPFGGRSVVGVDPGLRTGCKCAALDGTGKFLGNMTFNLVTGEAAKRRGVDDLVAFVRRHRPEAIAVGNGTGGREAERFVKQALKAADLTGIVVVQVNETGASVYSASPLAQKEHPDLDVTVRGAISIARRLQDPLAELTKIEPKSIGVGQYQHDVHQPLLVRKLDEVVESCVNRVGVELNTASAPLLARVAGIGPALADNIVARRDAEGAFRSRRQLLDVPKLGKRTFEQAAGFLRLAGASNPLDGSAVHPERYALVKRMASDLGVKLDELVGNADAAARIDVSRYVDDEVGLPTLRDIVAELERPGRDPRESFEAPAFRDDVETMEDLVEGMELEGVVTNVTAFGAFVDVGVHQDGLLHISELADRFVKDPKEVVSVGDRLKVRVLGVDLERRRISLSARSPGGRPKERRQERPRPEEKRGREKPAKFSYNPFAEQLKKRSK